MTDIRHRCQTDFGAIDFFTNPAFVPDPQPVLRIPAQPGAGREGVASRRGGGDRVRRHARGVQGRRTLVQLRGGRRSVSAPAVHTRGRRHQRADRGAPHPDAAARAHGGDGPAQPHASAFHPDPAAHAEPAEGQPGLPVGARRPPARRVRRRGECEFLTAYSKPFSLLAIADLLGVPREDHQGVPRRVGESAPDGQHRGRRRGDQPAGVPRREVQRLHRGAPRRATRRRAERTRLGHLPGRFASPPSPTWCAPRPSCSVRARRPRPSCWAPHCASCATVRSCSRRCATTPASFPSSSRRRCAGEPGQDRIPAGGEVDQPLPESTFRRARP